MTAQKPNGGQAPRISIRKEMIPNSAQHFTPECGISNRNLPCSLRRTPCVHEGESISSGVRRIRNVRRPAKPAASTYTRVRSLSLKRPSRNLLKSSLEAKFQLSGAKADVDFAAFSARLKSRPVTKPEYFNKFLERVSSSMAPLHRAQREPRFGGRSRP
jgi:hypothetical protein